MKSKVATLFAFLFLMAMAALAYSQLPATNRAAAKESTVKVKVFNKDGKLVGPVDTAKVVKTDAKWKEQLPAKTFAIARGKGTEPAFCGNLLDNKRKGVYSCICCGLPLFSSGAKFESGTGWPSFFQPVAAENVLTEKDNSHFMVRTEILCTAATAISAMFSTTARHPPICGIA